MERPEIYTDNYNSLEEWIELRKRNEEFVYPQFFVPFRTISGNPRQFNYRDESVELFISAHGNNIIIL